MANIHGFRDLNKGNNSGPPSGGGIPPMGGGGGGGGFFGGGGFPFFGGGSGGSGVDHKNVIHLHKEGELAQQLKAAGGKLVVVDFSASWCGPCRRIAPIYAELSAKYTNVVFLEIDVDELKSTAQQCGIRAMPTFQFYKNGSKIEEFSGADPNKLQSLIEKHKTATGSGSSMPGQGYVLGTRSSSSTPSTTVSNSTAASSTSTATNSGSTVAAASGDETSLFLSTLLEMGFSRAHAEKGLKATNSTSVEAAMDWCFNHPDEEPTTTTTSSSSTTTSTVSDAAAAPTPMDTDSKDADVKATETSAKEDTEPVVHNALCNVCMQKIVGIRYKCAVCSDYDLCSQCYENRTHNPEHTFDAHLKDIENPEKKPLTPEEIAEQKKRLQEKLKQVRAAKAKAEAEAEIEREKNRRKSGQEQIEAKKMWEARTREREAYLKKKEKEEERKAKLLIKQKIEQDKREREAAKQAAAKQTAPPTSAAAQPAETVKKEYTEALIQFRLPDGNTLKATFKPTDPIRTVHNHVSLLLGNQNVTLMTTFPKKIFGPRDATLDTTTLAQAECVPSGTFIVKV